MSCQPSWTYIAFADITGDIRAERKGSTAVTVPFKDTPKFVFTTNQILRYNADEDSFNRRFVEYKLNYWNFDHRPATHFGHNFFDGWDSDQWQLFFEFLVACCMISYHRIRKNKLFERRG